ncbi:YggU family protein [Candidatus Falkowbacteria bacterium]|nr:MAG: YggU family protein [Candidatus Falkowbacteria bacterium]
MISDYKLKLKSSGEVYLRVKARPGAGKTLIKEILEDDTIKIDIAAPPVKGKANQELIKLLAKEFCVEKKNINIISGKKDKLKLVKIIK